MVASGCSYASEFLVPRILRGGNGYPMARACQAALLQGHGGQDKSAMAQVFEALLGVQVRSRAAPAAEAAACPVRTAWTAA